jgi:hypothetical protein
MKSKRDGLGADWPKDLGTMELPMLASTAAARPENLDILSRVIRLCEFRKPSRSLYDS